MGWIAAKGFPSFTYKVRKGGECVDPNLTFICLILQNIILGCLLKCVLQSYFMMWKNLDSIILSYHLVKVPSSFGGFIAEFWAEICFVYAIDANVVCWL